MDKVRAIIDRFEGEYAICELEDLRYINILKDKLPKNVKEGDVLLLEGENIILDVEKTKQRSEYIKELTKDLWM